MEDSFKKAQRTLRTSGNMTANIIAVNGCCYGKSTQKDKGDYFKYCGQEFWEFISGQADLYTNIIEPLGHEAKIRNEKIDEEYAKIKNKCLQGFMSEFCKDDGSNRLEFICSIYILPWVRQKITNRRHLLRAIF